MSTNTARQRNDIIKTTFSIPKMDCGSEEQLVRMALDGVPEINAVNVDLNARTLDVIHSGEPQEIFERIDALGLGATMGSSVASESPDSDDETRGVERRTLTIVLLINFSFFLLEIITGLVGGSMGLVADSLDMLADCLVFAMSLFAVGGTLARKKNVAKASGYFQIILAIFGLVEVIRRFLGFGEVPEYQLMIIISSLALVGNAASIYILSRAKRDEAHMQASFIFLSNDVVINFGVILAGVFVYFTSSKFPDLIVGSVIFMIVARGAFRILKLAK